MHVLAFQALGDPTRLRILELLRRGEQPVNDVVSRLDIHQSGVSRHLRVLRDAGFVQMRAEGQQRLYSLTPEGFRDVDAWLAGFRAHWEARLDRFGDALATRRAARPREKT
ncbi:MAG: metalloregulator ArsR/SmtB family transcription factor [Polyangiales bacterium]